MEAEVPLDAAADRRLSLCMSRTLPLLTPVRPELLSHLVPTDSDDDYVCAICLIQPAAQPPAVTVWPRNMLRLSKANTGELVLFLTLLCTPNAAIRNV